MVPFLVPFWSQLWPKNGPQNGPKISPKNNNLGGHFWIPFLLGLGALRLPLGSLLGPPKALLGSLWTPKTLKNCMVFKVFANATFWVFGALDGHLGPILAPSFADLVPKLTPKWPPKLSKKCSKTNLKNDPQNYEKTTKIGGPKWCPKWSKMANHPHRQIWTGVYKTLLFSRWLQDGSRWPREAQDSLLGAFLGLQRLSWKAWDPQKP